MNEENLDMFPEELSVGEKRNALAEMVEVLSNTIASLPLDEKVEALNEAREALHSVSPFKNEPIDFVRWISTDAVHANDYNPNSVAPPEMALLEHSIDHDGFTQPVVGWQESDESYEVVDGFHRTTVAKRSDSVRERLLGYMPIVAIQSKTLTATTALPRPSGTTGREESIKLSQCQILLSSLKTQLVRYAHRKRAGYGPG